MPRHIPSFSYALTRPYPYAWFTPVAVIGATVLLTVFSIINYIINGYSLVVTTTSDPNSTIAENQLFRKWPHYLTDRIQPSCDPANIAVSSQISTNQSGLLYTVTGVDQEDGSVLPSLTYQNNLLQKCGINRITLDMDTQAANSWSQASKAAWITNVRAFVSCELALGAGLTRVNLTAVYNLVPLGLQRNPGVSDFIVQDKEHRASLWWAESLLSYYWLQVNLWMLQINLEHKLYGEELDVTGKKGSLLKGYIDMFPRKDVSDIKSLSFFEIDFNFAQPLGPNSELNYFVWWDFQIPSSDSAPITAQSAIDNNAYPPIWKISDSLAKSMHAAVLTDLGQVNDTGSNIVQQPEALQYFASNFTWYVNTPGGNRTVVKPGPAEAEFDASRPLAFSGPLGITPSVISTKYVCQVPQKRSSGNIALSIILADLVLLQAAWKLYTLIVNWLLVRRIPGANCCEACGGSGEGAGTLPASPGLGQEESIELLASPSQSSRTPFAGAYVRPAFSREESGRSLGLAQKPLSLG